MSLAARALAALLVGIAVVAGGYRAGVHTTDNAWRARLADAERAANTKYVRDVEAGIEAAYQAGLDKKQLENRYATLKRQHELLRKSGVPLVVASPPDACPADPHRPQEPERSAVRSGPELSVGAVWMWNSALAGRADVPPYPCGTAGADGGADPACAAGAGVVLDEAWDNHTENAQRASRNKARGERLMDFLRSRGQ